MKDGSFIRACHHLQTQLKHRRDLTGNRDRISVISSSGISEETAAVASIEVRSERRLEKVIPFLLKVCLNNGVIVG